MYCLYLVKCYTHKVECLQFTHTVFKGLEAAMLDHWHKKGIAIMEDDKDIHQEPIIKFDFID